MPPIRCVEPALANATDHSVVDVPVGQELLFPHVDTCLAIAMVLADGRRIGGHVSMMGTDEHADMDPWGNAMTTIFQMQDLRGVAAISQMVFVGDSDNWSAAVAELILSLGCANSLFVKTNGLGGGVDVLLEGDKVTVQGCTHLGRRYVLGYAYFNGKRNHEL